MAWSSNPDRISMLYRDGGQVVCIGFSGFSRITSENVATRTQDRCVDNTTMSCHEKIACDLSMDFSVCLQQPFSAPRRLTLVDEVPKETSKPKEGREYILRAV